MNGSNSTFEGRRFRSEKTEKFIWGTKMILLFNDNNFPQFDFSDTALVERILLVQHRSRFYADEAEFQKHKHKPYTFKACDLDDKMNAWRPYFLEWALEGLKNYQVKKFSTVPKACTDLRKGLVSGQDTITPFLEEHVEPGDIHDFIALPCLYEDFSLLNKESEKNKKTQVGKHKFYGKVAEILDTICHDMKKIKGKNHRKVIVGFKRKVDDSVMLDEIEV